MKGITLISLLLLVFMSCSESVGHKEEIPGVAVPKEELQEESITFLTEDDFFEFTHHCSTGKSYLLSFYTNSDVYYIYPQIEITSPGGVIDSSYSFSCTETGNYRFKLLPPQQYGSWPLSFTYKLTEFSSLERVFDGDWLFTKRTVRAFDSYQTFTASSDKAMRTLEFKNDSCIFTFYDLYGDSLYDLPQIYAESEYNNSLYYLNNNSLSFKIENAHGSTTDTYSRYSGTPEDLTWDGMDIYVPEELLGVWYYSSNEYRSMYTFTGDTVDESFSVEYETGDESPYIISIMKDSIVTYDRGFGYTDSISYSIKDSYFFLQEFERTLDGIVHNTATFWQDNDDYSAGYNKSGYTKYTGEDPALGWKSIAPHEVIDLNLDESFYKDVDEGDTVWLKLSFEAGKQYQVKLDNPAHALHFSTFFVDASTMEPEYFTEFYSANSTGTYYLVLFVFKSEDHSEIPPISLKVKRYSFYD